MVDLIATEYEAKCSAISVVVFQMLVGSVAADTKATKEMLTHSTTTETVERRRTRNRHTTGKSTFQLWVVRFMA